MNKKLIVIILILILILIFGIYSFTKSPEIKETNRYPKNQKWIFLKKYKNSISNLKLNISLYYKFSNKIPRLYNWYSLKNNKEFVPSFTKKIFKQVSTLF